GIDTLLFITCGILMIGAIGKYFRYATLEYFITIAGKTETFRTYGEIMVIVIDVADIVDSGTIDPAVHIQVNAIISGSRAFPGKTGYMRGNIVCIYILIDNRAVIPRYEIIAIASYDVGIIITPAIRRAPSARCRVEHYAIS